MANSALASESLSAQVSKLDNCKSKGSSKRTETNQQSVSMTVKQEGQKQKNVRFNHRVLRLLCAANAPPSIVNIAEWEEMITEANPILQTVCGSTFSSSYIPQEAANVLQQSIKTLQSEKHLTLTFDGGSTRRPQSVYTIHVTTPNSREAILLLVTKLRPSPTLESISRTSLHR